MNGRTLIVTVISVGAKLGLLIVCLHQITTAAIRDVQVEVARLGAEIHAVPDDGADLRERMARLEALFKGLTKREAAK